MKKNVSYKTTQHVRDTCLCLHAQRAARVLGRRFDEALRPLGLTNGQFSLMMALNRPDPPTMSTLAAFLAMDRTTLTAALKPLERDGLVHVHADPCDRRSRLASLTAHGHKTLAAALPIWRKTHKAIESGLRPSSPDRLRQGLSAMALEPRPS